MPRIAILALLAAAVGFTVLILSLPVQTREDLPVANPQQPVQFFSVETGAGALFQIDAASRFILEVTLPEVQAAPMVTLAALDRGLPPVTLELHTISAARFRASGELPGPGRWQILIWHRFGEERFELIVRNRPGRAPVRPAPTRDPG